MWWLSESANGTLHRFDQPVEQLYFTSPLEIVLPPDFDEKIVDDKLALTWSSSPDLTTLRAFFLPKGHSQLKTISGLTFLSLELSPVIHGPVECYPNTLGGLHDQLATRGAPFIDELRAKIKEKVPQEGIVKTSKDRCLLILFLPVKRDTCSLPEKRDVIAFLIPSDLSAVGESADVLSLYAGKYYATPLLGTTQTSEKWRDLAIAPIEVKYEVGLPFARIASGIDTSNADFDGVMAGVGALGSAILELWVREGWGRWKLIDPDIIKAHNLVRHIARNTDIGEAKVDVVKNLAQAIYHPGYLAIAGIKGSATEWDKDETRNAICSSTILVDATTTLDVPRDMSQREQAPRIVSIFVTPSGRDSVLLIESSDRQVRADSLEAQYYRALLELPLGSDHLVGNAGELWVGAGCRDISAKISYEDIQLHAAILAKQVRGASKRTESQICIWRSEPSGAVTTVNRDVKETVRRESEGWHVVWDKGVEDKMVAIRQTHLPEETGGVLVGYIDHKLRHIYVVDALSAPSDSVSERGSFIRGIDGLNKMLGEIGTRTANIVGYLGEWHSHPPFSGPSPSPWDKLLVKTLADVLAMDGLPALMMIVGAAREISVSVRFLA
jgi:integrative and conjugative element protein (TIGR02256 family)